MGSKTVFNSDWQQEDDFKNWLQSNKNDKHSAMCTLCNNHTFSLSNMGRQAVVSHSKGLKHIRNAEKVKKSYQIDNFFSRPAGSETSAPSTAEESTSVKLGSLESSISAATDTTTLQPISVNAKPQVQISKYLEKDKVTTAEILWCLQTVVHHLSLSGAGSCVDIFKRMFSDSDIAQKMALQRSKMAYVITYGLGPYFCRVLIDDISPECPHTVSFDESLNKMTQKSQMDLNVRYWSISKNKVVYSYLGSTFLGHTTAVDLLQAFKSETQNLDLNNLIQVSMDGPNVNLKFYRLFKAEVEAEAGHKLIDLGTCELHSLHNSFKTAMKDTKWELSEFLKAIYTLFKNVPARRADFIRLTESKKFPQKFCAVRWLHNADVAERAIEIIPSLKKYVEGVKNEKIEPKSKSYERMVEALKDPLLCAKLAFLQTLALEVEPLLRMFQADQPMAPFLHSDFLSLITSVFKRFIKEDVLEKYTSAKKLDVSKKDNLLSVKYIRIGHLTRGSIQKVSGLEEKDVVQFRQDCLKAFQTFCKKLQTNSPLVHDVAKAMTFCDPHLISDHKKNAMRRLSSYIQHLMSIGWISGISCDKVEREFANLCNKPGMNEILKNYSREERLDDFWMRLFLQYNCSSDLTKFIRLTLIFSHGQGDIERGFSINKECLFDNLSEKLIVAQRHVWEGVKNQGGINKIEITKSMIHYVRNARGRYNKEIQKIRKEDDEKKNKQLQKRKAKEKLSELNEKKRRIVSKEAALEEEIRQTMSVLGN